MIRSMIVFNLVLLGAGFAHALVPVPIPRLSESEWEPHLQQAKKAAEGTTNEDPAKKVERITQAAEELGERLKMSDTSADTLSKQEQLLKDIDSLLKPPPPMNNGGGGGDSNKNMNDMNDSKMPPPMGSGTPMGNSQQQPMGKDGKNGERNKPDRSPRGSDSKPKPMPMNGEPMPKGMPMPMSNSPMNTEPMGTKSEPASGTPGTGSSRTPPTLPLEDSFSKQVWGHLPEKMRQQVSQYYRDQYMPRYSEMLKQYYSSLAEREKQGK